MNSRAIALASYLIAPLTIGGGTSGCVALDGDTMIQAAKSTERVERMLISFDRELGYILRRTDNLEKVIFPRFANELVKGSFDKFFDQNNLAKFDGKKIYCDCSIINESENILIVGASIFAE